MLRIFERFSGRAPSDRKRFSVGFIIIMSESSFRRTQANVMEGRTGCIVLVYAIERLVLCQDHTDAAGQMALKSALSSVLAGLRHLTRLGHAADLFPSRSHLRWLFPVFRLHPFRRRASGIRMLFGLITHLQLERMT